MIYTEANFILPFFLLSKYVAIIHSDGVDFLFYPVALTTVGSVLPLHYLNYL